MSTGVEDMGLEGTEVPLMGLTSALAEERPQPMNVDGTAINFDPDGSVVVNFDPQAKQPDQLLAADTGWFGNLARSMPKTELDMIGQEVLQYVRFDMSARAGWMDVIEKGIKTLGIDAKRVDNFAIKNASQVVHPLMIEALVQFQARAIQEMFPAGGPAKGMVLGDSNEDLMEQADRVANYMNYHLTQLDRGYFEDTDQMMFMVGFEGSQFRKIYQDETGVVRSRRISSADFLVPYTSASLDDTPRFTHIFRLTPGQLERAFQSGQYVRFDYTNSGAAAIVVPSDELRSAADNDGGTNTNPPDDMTPVVMYECNVERKINGEFGVYVVTVEANTGSVVSLRRDWNENDKFKRRRTTVVHYKYLPGPGFYGLGLLHAIGQLGEAATGLLRAIIDTAARANFSGGYRSKEARVSGNISPGLGEWVDVEMTAEELQKAFYALPYREPGSGVFQALNNVEQNGQRFAATTETMVGDSAATGPVGTTMALIEQGSKVYSAIHKRTHKSLGDELRIIASLLGEQMAPDQLYPYYIEGEQRVIMKSDFDGRVDVLPVSDPNLVSNTQRIVQAQTALELTMKGPDLYSKKARQILHERLLKALRVPDAEALLTIQDDPAPPPPPLNPLTENDLIMSGKPVQAYLEQNHDAHMQLHKAGLMLMQASMPPEAVAELTPRYLAHIAEHVAMKLRAMVTQRVGGQVPDAPLPPEMEAQLSLAATDAVMKLMPPATIGDENGTTTK